MNILEKALGIMNRSQLLTTDLRSAGMITGTIGQPANWAMVIRPGLMMPKAKKDRGSAIVA